MIWVFLTYAAAWAALTAFAVFFIVLLLKFLPEWRVGRRKRRPPIIQETPKGEPRHDADREAGD